MKFSIFATGSALRSYGVSCAFLLGMGLSGAAQANVFSVTILVTNDQTSNAAQFTDSSLRNAWGIPSSPTSPFRVSNDATDVATLYNVNPATSLLLGFGLAAIGFSRCRKQPATNFL